MKFTNKLLHPTVTSILLRTNGWLVGNAINDIIHDKKVSDYDIIVPNRELFQHLIKDISTKEFSINNYGGVKIDVDGLLIDIWCEELSDFLGNANKISYLYNHKKNITLKFEL